MFMLHFRVCLMLNNNPCPYLGWLQSLVGDFKVSGLMLVLAIAPLCFGNSLKANFQPRYLALDLEDFNTCVCSQR